MTGEAELNPSRCVKGQQELMCAPAAGQSSDILSKEATPRGGNGSDALAGPDGGERDSSRRARYASREAAP